MLDSAWRSASPTLAADANSICSLMCDQLVSASCLHTHSTSAILGLQRYLGGVGLVWPSTLSETRWKQLWFHAGILLYCRRFCSSTQSVARRRAWIYCVSACYRAFGAPKPAHPRATFSIVRRIIFILFHIRRVLGLRCGVAKLARFTGASYRAGTIHRLRKRKVSANEKGFGTNATKIQSNSLLP